MNSPRLEDHLHRLADDLTAPPTSTARQAIGRRAGVLRRRRRVRTAAGAGVLAAAIVTGGLALRHDPADVELGPVTPGLPPAGVGALRALTVDGWDVVSAEEILDVPPDGGPVDDPNWQGSVQVFRRPGELTGPTVYVQHVPVSDAVVEGPGEPVAIGDATGFISGTGTTSISLRWQPQFGDSAVELHAWDLSETEVLDIARGLELKDTDISYPGADDEFGFAAPWLPAGMEDRSTVDDIVDNVQELSEDEWQDPLAAQG